jgi:hemerythrin superfamily protein
MVEHAVLRTQFRLGRETNFNSIYDLEEFIRTCHAKIEDEVVFPKLRDSLQQTLQEKVTKDLSRLEADHRLIDKIGDQIKIRTVEGNRESLEKRILLYINTVESHNSGEELLIFPHWNVPDTEEQEAKSRAWKIIENFGLSRYLALTGFSEKLSERMH